MAEPTWDDRDLPILVALVEMFDAGGSFIQPEEIAAKTGIDVQTIQVGLRALMYSDPEYVGVTSFDTFEGQAVACVNYVTGADRRVVATWPTPEGRATEIVALLR
jgi:hypothetical protein